MGPDSVPAIDKAFTLHCQLPIDQEQTYVRTVSLVSLDVIFP